MESGSSPAAPIDRSARLGAAIAGAGGILLLISLFVPWYTVPGAGLIEDGPLSDILQRGGEAIGVDTKDAVSSTGWEAFEIADVICLLAAAVAMARAAVVFLGDNDDPPVPGTVLTISVGVAALVLVLYRFVNPPGIGQEREIGVWLGAFAAAAIVYGSYVTMQARD